MAKYAVFDTAPVHEVVFSVQFGNRLVFKAFDGPAIHAAFADRYPRVLEQAPLPQLAFPETAASTGGFQLINIEEPRARWWFLAPDDDELVEIQDDRFARNWRKFGVAPSAVPTGRVLEDGWSASVECPAQTGEATVPFAG